MRTRRLVSLAKAIRVIRVASLANGCSNHGLLIRYSAGLLFWHIVIVEARSSNICAIEHTFGDREDIEDVADPLLSSRKKKRKLVKLRPD